MRFFSKLLLAIIFLFCSSISFADNNDFSDSTKKTEELTLSYIAGFPTKMESHELMMQYLSDTNWRRLTVDTTQKGLITRYAGDKNNDRCVIYTNHIYLYEKGRCTACFSFSIPGNFTLFCYDNYFYINDYRSDYFLQFDSSGAIALYNLRKDKHNRYDNTKLGEPSSGRSLKSSNYRIENHHPPLNPIITGSYDSLYWDDILLYETTSRPLYWIPVIGPHILAGIIVMYYYLTKWRKNKRKKA